MPIERVSPEEAASLMEEQGYVYLDVRSMQEFEQGHPTGAFNVPLLHMSPAGMEPNPDFADVVKATFDRDAKIVVGCKAGGRSLKATMILMEAGYANVVDQRAGFVGAVGPGGQIADPGWQPKGLPVSTTPEVGRDYEALTKKAGKG